jgi:hypothetical protein
MADAAYRFVSYLRSGFAASIAQPDTFGPGQPALATAASGVTVSGVAQPVSHTVTVRGPGDVIGIAAAQVVRTDPIDGAVGVEPNYFAQIEFDRPDLPWMFTPAAAVGDRLRPWIVLVVVDADGAAACSITPGPVLAVLHVPQPAAAQLPNLAESWLWAHAQVITPDGRTAAAALADPTLDPRLTVSRLLSPRHLAPNRWYLAAVVPAFAVGRLAGLGQAVSPADEAKLDPAWTPGAAADLPVYASWRFRTGEDADFESLARKLQARPLPAGVGTRPLDVSRPGAGLPSTAAPADTTDTTAIEWLEGALRPLDSDALPARDAAAAQGFATALTVLLDRPADLLAAGDADPIVVPPIYGDQHALVVRLDVGSPPPWITELNLEPRHRVAAGLGTQVVQARQEDFVARAWRQLGDVLAANRLLRAAQLARSSSLRVHQRLGALDPATSLAIASPAHQRIVGAVAPGVTVATAITASRLPDVTTEPAFRRMTRASSAAGRAATSATLAPDVVQRFAATPFSAPVGGPDGATAMRAAGEVIGATAAAAVLTGLGDSQPAVTGRLDAMLGTLAANVQTFPTGAGIEAQTQRTDVGAVTLTSALGAVSAGAITAVLTAATTPDPPSPPPPPTQPPPTPTPTPTPHPQPPVRPPVGGPVGERPPLHPAVTTAVPVHLPPGLIGTVGAATTAVGSVGTIGTIVVGSVQQTLDGGAILRGGKIVATDPVVSQVVDHGTVPAAIDDTRWASVIASGVVVGGSTGNTFIDTGSRLDAVRRDPTAITALADLGSGDLDAAVTLDRVTGGLATSASAASSIDALSDGQFATPAPTLGHVTFTSGGDFQGARDMTVAAGDALDRMVHPDDAPDVAPGPAVDLAAAHGAMMSRLDPETTVVARVNSRLVVDVLVGVVRRDDLDPVMASPRYDDPMWQALRDLGAGWLLPGLEKLPPDTATIVRTNPLFVGAHMVGLNHEMMRELLWREYPTDQRGTPFHRFWGRSGDQPDDVGPIHLLTADLAHSLLAQTSETVLLLRSELLRRYPGSIIYVCRAKQSGAELVLDDDTIVLPSFRGDLPPDVSFVGFPLSPDDLRTTGDPWWFVIAQPPTEPRFGIDDADATTPQHPTSADDLAWSHMDPHGRADPPAPFAVADAPMLSGPLGGLTWATNAAVQADLTYQHPVRVAIAAASMVPPEPGAHP